MVRVPDGTVSVGEPDADAVLIKELHAMAAEDTGGGGGAAAKKLLARGLSAAEAAAAGRGVPPALSAALAPVLAAAADWTSLELLLSMLPLQGLPGSCSQLLALVARAGQTRLLAPLCCKLDEPSPGDVVAALSALLAPTCAENLPARR
eukprot:219956-Chlamydomonas_euryale.AAC.1